MVKKIFSLLAVTFLLGFAGCKEEGEIIDPTSSEPVIKFAYDILQADMNKVDNLPVVAVVQSNAGLKKVVMKIQTASSTINYKEVTDFFNSKSYSIAEKISYKPDYQAFIVTATDKLGREVTDTLSLGVIDVMEAPQIIFNPAIIEYDELIGGPMPATHFTVTSVAGLKSLEMYLVTKEAQAQYGFTIESFENNKEFTFTENILYKEGDKGFKVKATDIYGQAKIVTMPVKYLTPRPPTVTLKSDTIYADKDEKKPVQVTIESQRGIKEIKVYRIEGTEEILASTIERSDLPATLKLAPEVVFTNATSKIKITVTDAAQKTTEVTATAIVNMVFAKSISMGSHPLANGNASFPDVYAMLSLKDLKTYAVDYALASAENAANVDLKFYCFGGSAVLRMYSIDGGTGTKSNEFKGKNGSVLDMEVQNATRLLKLPGFDFENATAASIARDIPASNIVSNNVNPFVVGDVIAFKTASTSTSGGGRVGIMKILTNEQAIPTNVTARIITVSIKFPKE